VLITPPSRVGCLPDISSAPLHSLSNRRPSVLRARTHKSGSGESSRFRRSVADAQVGRQQNREAGRVGACCVALGDGRRTRSRSIARRSVEGNATRDHLARGELIGGPDSTLYASVPIKTRMSLRTHPGLGIIEPCLPSPSKTHLIQPL
jgi:hypothetical protein